MEQSPLFIGTRRLWVVSTGAVFYSAIGYWYAFTKFCGAEGSSSFEVCNSALLMVPSITEKFAPSNDKIYTSAIGKAVLLLLAAGSVAVFEEFDHSRLHWAVQSFTLDPIYMTVNSEVSEKSETGQAAKVTTDKTRYRSGELIAVTLTNELSTTIFAPPPGSAFCSVVSVEKLEVGTWVMQGACEAGATGPLISLGPRTMMRAALILAESGLHVHGFVSKPVQPAMPEAQPGTRPVDKPWKRGDLRPQYPEGIINVRGLLYPSVDHSLSPGTYRIVFIYAVGAPAGKVEKVYSEIFEVTG